MINKFRKIISLVLALTIFSSFFNIKAAAQTANLALNVNARSAVIMETETGKILFEQNADERLTPASVTKIMTIYLIYEALAQDRIKWDDIVTVSEHAASMGGSQIFLEPNEKQTVRDLTKSIVIASANDAAVAMAEFVSGSEESFVDLMNRRAADFGLRNTSFKNACGLDADGHFSSAKDIAIMSRELILKYPQVHEFSTIWQDTIVHKTARGEDVFGLTNTNKLIKWYNGANGLKTGSTSKALFCLSATAERDKMKLIAVVMASPTPSDRFNETMKMFDYGFANYKIVQGEEAGKIVGKIKINKGKEEFVEVAVKEQISEVAPKGSEMGMQPEVLIDECLAAPAASGTKAGEIVYTYNGQVIGKSDLVTTVDVEKATFIDTLKRLPVIMFGIGSEQGETVTEDE